MANDVLNLRLRRIARKETYTIGKLYVDGLYYCDTLEPTDRGLTNSMSVGEIAARKVYGKTAIPTGTYEVTTNWSNVFKRFLPLVNGVKGYVGIRFHPGNGPDDTLACILVGQNKVVGKVINSRKMFEPLYLKIREAKKCILEVV